ncbi:hypothetical protein PIB30_038330 [Stylosanthes scabra]|uniref:Uncharacterized protein n=1 Tax=Stylosanthes scabra TaxID=79078 RepID=A0ABU6WEB2_9FABA|nr:hypothetical protein [Stylosanthes scabra]
MAKKAELKSKNPPMRARIQEYQPSADSEATESNLAANAEIEPDPEPEQEAEQIPQREIRSKWKNDRTVVASNAPMHTTQQSVAGPGSLAADSERLVDYVKKTERRKSQRIANMHKKQKLDQLNEVHGATRSPSETRMFDTFDTVSLGRDDSDQVAVEGTVVAPTQPSQPEKEDEHHENINEAGFEDKEARVAVTLAVDEVMLEAAQPQGPTEDDAEHTEIYPEPISIQIPFEPEAGVEDKEAGVAVPLVVDEVMLEEAQPEPLVVVIPVQPEEASKSEVEAPHNVVEEEKEPEQQSEVEAPHNVVEEDKEPDPINIDNPFEPEVTLKPWLNPVPEATDAKDTPNIIEEIITDVLLSMKKEDKVEEGNQDQQPGDQEECNTPEAAPASMEERCFIWATTENNNKYNTIFQLRGPNTIEAMRYNFMTMALKECIDMYMVSLVCHILNREQVHRFQREVYCVPPEILDQLDGFREKIVAKVLFSEHNTLNFEAMNQSRTMTREAITEGRTKLGRRPKPSATLKSPFRNPSTAELEKKQ